MKDGLYHVSKKDKPDYCIAEIKDDMVSFYGRIDHNGHLVKGGVINHTKRHVDELSHNSYRPYSVSN
jgi:hypothetical protein